MDEEDLIEFDPDPTEEDLIKFDSDPDEEDLIEFDDDPIEEDLIDLDSEPIEEMKHLCLLEDCVCTRHGVQKDGATALPSTTNSSSQHQAIVSTPSLNNNQSDVQTTHNTTRPTGVQVVLPNKAAEKKEVATAKRYKRDPTVCLVGFHNHYLPSTFTNAPDALSKSVGPVDVNMGLPTRRRRNCAADVTESRQAFRCGSVIN
ncbi:hypothetical protein CSIM01_00180 [Colletotrichum simmondsii]|uniref:Uncharacterized protein n=1 Tax=Colletotrichum simmondsii TaxID=703756 RepID=A0A135SMG8_9PEZI|nr:hypothetical protein CSIM01_00180 [Colletotrichum simmondsii]